MCVCVCGWKNLRKYCICAHRTKSSTNHVNILTTHKAEGTNLAIPMYSSRRSDVWTHKVARTSALLTLLPNIRTVADISYARFHRTLEVMSCPMPCQLSVRSLADAKHFPDGGRTVPSTMELCKSILQPLPDQFLMPSSNSGFKVISFPPETYSMLPVCHIGKNVQDKFIR